MQTVPHPLDFRALEGTLLAISKNESGRWKLSVQLDDYPEPMDCGKLLIDPDEILTPERRVVIDGVVLLARDGTRFLRARRIDGDGQ